VAGPLDFDAAHEAATLMWPAQRQSRSQQSTVGIPSTRAIEWSGMLCPRPLTRLGKAILSADRVLSEWQKTALFSLY
jgi:hypothetical protein